MKKFLILFIISLLIPLTANAQIQTSARSAILLNGNTGAIVYEKDAYTPRPIASLTKVMTAILTIESVGLDERVTVSEEAASQEPSSCPLQAGDNLSVRDLLYCLLLQSGNDAAYALAEYVAGNVPDFVTLMNNKAKSLKMNQTNFTNPSGLDVPASNTSTAYDLSLLMQYAMNNQNFREITGAKNYQTTSANGIPYSWTNKHRLVRNIDWVIGGKTGFTRRAGRTLISVGEINNLRLIAVTLNDPNDWEDHIKMFRYGYGLAGSEITLPENYLREDGIDRD